MDYRTFLTGTRFSFSGWEPGESPVECWAAGEWLKCLHGCILCCHLIGDPEITHAAVADDAILHELVHLASGIPVCTHGSMALLEDRVRKLQAALDSLVEFHAHKEACRARPRRLLEEVQP